VRWATGGVCLLVLAVLPVLVGGHRGYGLGTTAAIAVILALGYQVTFGLSGQLSVAHAPLQGVGAYAVARLMVTQHWSFWPALVAGALAAAAVGAVVGLPGLRVRGDVLALATLGAGEILQSLYLHTTSFTGGFQGIAGVGGVSLFGRRLGDHGLYGVALGAALLVLSAVLAVRASPLGRAWLALRDDELAATSLGVRSGPLRLLAFALGAAVAGVAGGLYAVQNGFVSSVSFGLSQTVTIILVVLVAGEARIGRTVLAAVAYTVIVDRLAAHGTVSEGLTGALILAVVAFRLGLLDRIRLRARTAGAGARLAPRTVGA
jgi:ABC-type branched-subunit amino acid transport system permease subunit